MGTRRNPDTIGYVWTGEFDLNTLRVDGEIFESGKKKLRIQKYPDTCGQVLKFFFTMDPQCEVDCCRFCGVFLDNRRKRNIVWELAKLFETVIGVEILKCDKRGVCDT